MTFVRTLRTGLWHLRKGGPKQLGLWWRRRECRDLATPTVTGVADTQLRPDSPKGQTRTLPPLAKAGCILDEFSELAWSDAFELLPLTPAGWRSTLDEHSLDLLLVESAWRGSHGAWQYQLVGPEAPSAQLQELVQTCRGKGIPTVFWNKEDPPHFEDFLATARLFDVVFTTAEELVDSYRAELGHDRVYVLPFAAAATLHNPVRLRSGYQVKDVAFAGTYFTHKYPERRAQIDVLIGGALDASPRLEHGLDIYSRFLDDGPQYQFPDEFSSRVVGALSYPDMLVAYKAYKLFLNVNSVVDSPSMCARRVFELLASGTAVLSTPSQALPRFFPPDELPTTESRQEAELMVRALVNSPELRDRMVHRAQRRIWREHTYRLRGEQLLTASKIPYRTHRRPSVSVLAATCRPAQLHQLFDSVVNQESVDLQLVLVTHGFEAEPRLIAQLRERGLSHLETVAMPKTATLGECLRDAVARSDGEVLSKMDDDDLYGPHYLSDLLDGLMYSGADVIGKQAHHMHFLSSGINIVRFENREHRWTDFIMGPTITGHRQVFMEVPFADLTVGEDTDWLRRVSGAGANIYAADRFNFVQVRGTSHTWQPDEAQLLASGRVVFVGDPRQHVFI